jgi:glycosyltransferase involved in cell wall biosynthesis
VSALSTFRPTTFPGVTQGFPRTARFGILTAYPPTLCGLATFGAGLVDGLIANGASVNVVRVADGELSASDRVIGELATGSPASVAACAELLNQSDVAVIQYACGAYGSVDGDDVIGIIDGLRVPSIVIAHTIVKSPTRRQRSVFEMIAAQADQVVVVSEAAGERLRSGFAVDRRKIVTVAHGAAVPPNVSGGRGRRPTVLTWGLLGPGKGIERVIEAMKTLRGLPGRPRYIVAGPTHPKTLAAEGEAYRDARIEQARRGGVADAVSFDAGYRNAAMLTALVQSAAVVVLPYDSTHQDVSGVLVDAIANGRPVVATAFPHAVEVLCTGAGTVVAHDDQDALVAALRRVLTDPRFAGSMAAEARRLAPDMAWPVVAGSYQKLAHQLLAGRRRNV